MKKILIASNSQGSASGVQPGENYPCLLQAMLPEISFHYLILSGGSIREFNTYAETIAMAQPDLVIFQIGIVDCVQRILSNREKDIFRILPWGRHITRKLHEHRLRVIKLRNALNLNARLISPAHFRAELQMLTQKLDHYGIRRIFFEIPKFASKYETEYYPYINSDIDLYNGILREFDAIPLLTPDDDLYAIWQPGTVHFTADGHRCVAQKIKEMVARELDCTPSPSLTC